MSADLAAFRGEVRAWLERHCPPSMRTPMKPGEEVWGGKKPTFVSDDARRWFEAAVGRGFTAPTWPREYGGAGLSEAEAHVLADEMRALGCRRPMQSLGLWMLGPVLLEVGSEEQKRRFLPGIARGETRWCQGYSEPGAGSDLAGLSTRAVRDGEVYVVNGQKVWTSHADKADWMFCLVRTDPAAPKHEGISFLLVDMTTPGIRVRPLSLISGHSPFCETFFDDVRVPVGNRIGAENQGWDIGKRVLQYERTAISGVRDANLDEGESLPALARRVYGAREGRIADPVMRDKILQVELDFLCNRLTMQRSREAAQAGQGPGAASSMFKMAGTEVGKRRKELRVQVLGYQGLGWDGDGFADDELAATRDWLRSRAASIEGGTTEIQLNIIAKRVLGLPD